MNLPNGNIIIKADDLTRPAEVLIEKISDAIGGVFKPYQMRRIARANADAAIIEAQTQIKITQLHRRAMARFINEETKKQDNIEKWTAPL